MIDAKRGQLASWRHIINMDQDGFALLRAQARAAEEPDTEIPVILCDLAPKFYPVLSSLQRFLVAVVGSVAAGCGAEPFRLRSTASRR
ncbi:hypothetical protein, partial [Rhizobium leguminosarum]|uniref:hypothetical protein n=1 Tax=Rhizobium leguminosarum TaxID=384 RepID=UPI001C959BE2